MRMWQDVMWFKDTVRKKGTVKDQCSLDGVERNAFASSPHHGKALQWQHRPEDEALSQGNLCSEI